jgi:hypothetical protein
MIDVLLLEGTLFARRVACCTEFAGDVLHSLAERGIVREVLETSEIDSARFMP